MNNEQIKFIAKGLFQEEGAVTIFKSKGVSERVHVYRSPFNPFENWNDCGLVLEALVRESGNGIDIVSGIYGSYWNIEMPDGEQFCAEPKHAICQAYLNLKGWEGDSE